MRKTEGGQETSEGLWAVRVHAGPAQMQGRSRHIIHTLDPPLTWSNSGCSWRSKGHSSSHTMDGTLCDTRLLICSWGRGKELSQPQSPPGRRKLPLPWGWKPGVFTLHWHWSAETRGKETVHIWSPALMRRKHSLTSTRWGQEAYSSTQQLANRDRKAEKVLPLRLGHRACLKPRDCSRKAKSPSYSSHSPHPPLTWHQLAPNCLLWGKAREQTGNMHWVGVYWGPPPPAP